MKKYNDLLYRIIDAVIPTMMLSLLVVWLALLAGFSSFAIWVLLS